MFFDPPGAGLADPFDAGQHELGAAAENLVGQCLGGRLGFVSWPQIPFVVYNRFRPP